MTTIETISDAARRLTPDEVRDRLAELDREARILRAILRAAIRVQSTRPRPETQGAAS